MSRSNHHSDYKRYRRRYRRKHRKPPKRLIEVFITLGTLGLAIGGLIMASGVIYLNRFNCLNMLFAGMGFFGLSLVPLALGLTLKHLTNPDIKVKSLRSFGATAKKPPSGTNQHLSASNAP